MKKIWLFVFTIFIVNAVNSQLLGVYEFTGTGNCPNQDPKVTSQPVDTEFDSITMKNVFCVSTGNVHNTKSWNTTATINLSEFLQFGLHTISCYRFNLDSIVFDFRNTQAGGTPTYHLRSSIDNYATDIASGQSMTLSGSLMLTDTIILNSSNFSLLSTVKFRLYLTEMASAGAAFRIDNLKIYGSETFVGTVDYFADADGDGYGTGVAIPACTNPGGYSLNNLDCDDTDATINPETFWYKDNDGDGFGNDMDYEIGCTTTFTNGVTNSDDCDDTNSQIHPNTVWYNDADNDGFGDDDITEIGCTNSFAIASLTPGDCMDDQANVYPNAPEICDDLDNDCNNLVDDGLARTTYYIDNDGDGYGSGSAGDFCNDPGIGYVLNNIDCDDDNSLINPVAQDIPNNGIDEDCDGSDALASLKETTKTTIQVFPNPGSNLLFITTSNFDSGNYQILITDNQGKIILKDNLDLNQLGVLEINTTGFSKGSYQIVIQNDQQLFRNSWVKL